MPDSDRPLGGEPPLANRFRLEVDGVQIGFFLEVSGLEMRIDVHEHTEGGQNGFVHKLPGRISWPNLVFKRGLVDSDALFSWVARSSGEGFAAAGSTLTRTTGAVSLLGDDGKPLRSWSLIEPFPMRWTGPRLVATSSDPLDEEVEVAHHGFTAKTFPPS